jgi:membrane protease YdiL (CAAX protease family)
MVMLRGHVVVGRVGIHIGGIVVALFFALSYVVSIFTAPLYVALGQMAAAFVFGLALAYVFEKSNSLLSPILAHSLAEATRLGLVFLAVAMTR